LAELKAHRREAERLQAENIRVGNEIAAVRAEQT
jgi:hypothetical protein